MRAKKREEGEGGSNEREKEKGMKMREREKREPNQILAETGFISQKFLWKGMNLSPLLRHKDIMAEQTRPFNFGWEPV